MENDEIKFILEHSKTIAAIGCSSNPEKAAHRIPKYMKEHGYKIIPVNPNSENILGEKTYKSILDVKVCQLFSAEACITKELDIIQINW